MKKLPEEKRLQALVKMAQDFEAQMREQSETAMKISIQCEEAIKEKQNKQQAK